MVWFRGLMPLFVVGVLVLATGSAIAQGPKLETVFPLGIVFEQPVEFTLTGDAVLKAATTLWSPQAELDVERIDDAKAIRFRITARPRGTMSATGPFPLTGIDLYAVGEKGLGGPLRLQVTDSQLAEVLEDESSGRNDTLATAQPVAINAVVNAAIDPATDSDCYRVTLSAGQPLRVRFQSTSLGNAVEPAITIFDPNGRELLHDDGSDLEPTLALRAPIAGDYTIRVHERVWRKPAAAGYRLTITDRPVLLAAFPAVLIPDTKQDVELTGYGLTPSPDTAMNADAVKSPATIAEPLSTTTVSLTPPAHDAAHHSTDAPAGMVAFPMFHYQHPETVGAVRLGWGDATTQVEDDAANQQPQSALFLTLPADVSGRFLQPRDQDWYRVQVKKDQTLWFDAYGERQGLLMDLQIDIHDAQGKLLTSLSDTAAGKDRKDPLAAATLDPVGSWKAPADGEYRFILRDLYGTSVAGPTRQYRLFVTEHPVGECVIANEIVNLKPGETAKLALYHHGPAAGKQTISVTASDLPAGITAEPAQLPTGGKPGELVLKAADDAPVWTGVLTLHAERDTQPLPVRAVTPWRAGAATPLRQTTGSILHVLPK